MGGARPAFKLKSPFDDSGDSSAGRAITRKPSCVILCSQLLPESSLSVLVGRHGAMNSAGRARCNMRIELGRMIATSRPRFFC